MKVLKTRTDPVTGEIYKIVGEEYGNPVTLEQLESMGVVTHSDVMAQQGINNQTNTIDNEENI